MRATGIDCGNLRPWERVERLRRAACRAVLLLGGSLAAVEAASEPLAAVDPHAPGQFDHHPDIAIQLWAAEPLVVDPVAVVRRRRHMFRGGDA